jgi:O-antigen ligase
MSSLVLSVFIFSPYLKLRAALLVLMSFILSAFMFTLSRGGWLAFAPMYAALIVLAKRGRMIFIVAGIIALFVIPKFLPKVVYNRVHETFSGQTINIGGKKLALDESATARIYGMKLALDKFKQRPLIGFGVPAAQIIDNQYARVLRETGLLGLLAFSGIIIAIFKTVYNAYKTADDWIGKALSLGVIGGLVGILFQSFSAESFIIIRIMEPFWFLTAIAVSLPEIESQEKFVLGQQTAT